MADKETLIGACGLGGESVFLRVEHFHAPGETLKAEDIHIEAGGKAYNQAVAVARLGEKAVFLGAAGNDSGAALCKQTLINEGVTPVLQTIPGSHTAYACILTDAAGENRVTVSRGAAQQLSAAFIRAQEAVIARCTHLLLGLECPLDATLAALTIAKKHNVMTILNPAPAIRLDMALLRSFDLLTPNQQEASVLLGLSSPPDISDLPALLRKAGLTRTIVTLGAQGALWVNDQQSLLFPALPVQAVDTTGAGDAFNAGLAVALSRGYGLRIAIEYAINVSACAVGKRYALASLPEEKDVLKAYRNIDPL